MRRAGGLALATLLLCSAAAVAVPEAVGTPTVLSPQENHERHRSRLVFKRGIVQLRQFRKGLLRGAVRLHELVWKHRFPATTKIRRFRIAEVIKGFLAAGLKVSPSKNGFPDFSNEKAVRPGDLLYGEYKLYPDHSWAQVMRFGSGCNAAIEGLSSGFVYDCGSNYTKMGRPELAPCGGGANRTKVGYGCWFFFSDPFVYRSNASDSLVLGSSSGVAVNVGKSLRVDTRADASAALALPCDNPPLCDLINTVQDKVCVRA